MKRYVLKLYDFFSSHRRLLVPSLLAVIVLFVLLSSGMRPQEDITAFLPKQQEYGRISEAYSSIRAANMIMVTVSPRTDDVTVYRLMDAADSMTAALLRADAHPQAETGHIRSIDSGADNRQIVQMAVFMVENMPLYLDSADYVRMERLVDADSVSSALDRAKASMYSFQGAFTSDVLLRDPMMFSSRLLSSLESLAPDNGFTARDGYLFDADGNLVFFIESAHPVGETMGNKALTVMVDDAVGETCGMFPDCSIDAFGPAYVSVANADTIKRDTILSVAVSPALLLVLLLYAYGSFRPIALILATLLFGLAGGVAAVSALSPEVSLIVLGIGSVLIGIAANYPLHFLDHVADGYTSRKSISDIFYPLTIGNVTTVGAFLSLVFISSPAMRSLGIYASAMLVGTMFFVLVFLPHFTARVKVFRRRLLPDAITESRMRHPALFAVLTAVFTAALYFVSASGSHFDGNLSNINYMPAEYRQKMSDMLDKTGGGTTQVYVVSEGDDPAEALEAYGRLSSVLDSQQAAGIGVSGIGELLPSRSLQQERIGLWNGFVEKYGERLWRLVDSSAASKGFVPGAFGQFREMMEREYAPEDIEAFSVITDGPAANYLAWKDGGLMVVTVLNVPADRVRQVEESVAAALPDGDSFVFDGGSLMRGLVDTLSADFDKVLYICSLLVLVFLFVSFGRLELTVAAFLPLFVGWIWILGIMEIFSIDFNIVNIILATFIFGMGDDYTIFMLEGSIYEYTYGRRMLGRYRNTIALSAATMFIGIGSLIVARHPAMKGLAQVTIVGMAVVVAMAYTLPPLIFNFLTRSKGEKRRFPVTLASVARTAVVYLYLAVCGALLVATGFVSITLLRGGRRARERYCRLMKGMLRFASMHFFGNKCEYADRYGEDFSVPSVVICNHQSSLDLMLAMGLSDRFAIVMNRWNTRVFGPLVKYAGYIPVSDIHDGGMSMVAQAISDGRSIFIFPEGTRSRDCSIGRFRKGAFEIADRFGLDIVEVLVHGTGHCLPKGSVFVESFPMRCEVVRRIPNARIPSRKDLRRIVADDYSGLCLMAENAAFCRKEVMANFRYKEKSVRKDAMNALASSDDASLRSLASEAVGGRLVVEEKGYGAFSLLAALVLKDVEIYSYVRDHEHYEVAVNCALVPSNLHFVDGSSGRGRNAVIMGGGMSGLVCGALLADAGYDVTVLEKQRSAGGGLGSFSRDGIDYDIGAHTIFGFGDSGAFGAVLRKLSLSDKVRPLPVATPDGSPVFGHVYSANSGRMYSLFSGRDRFERHLASLFPSESEGLKRYLDCVYAVADSIPLPGVTPADLDDVSAMHSDRRSLSDVLDDCFSGQEIKTVLSWVTMYTGLPASESLFVLSALITKLYIEESCLIQGGVPELRKALVASIEGKGGRILTGRTVSSVSVCGPVVRSVSCSTGESFESSVFVSAMPLERFLSVFSSSLAGSDKDYYSRWLSRTARKLSLRSGRSSMFSLYVRLKPGSGADVLGGVPFTYMSAGAAGVRDSATEEWPCRFTAIPHCKDGAVDSVQVHAFMSFDAVALWESSLPGDRPEDYVAFKDEMCVKLLSLLDKLFPGFSSIVDSVVSSSPLTVRDWLGRPCGDVYGPLAVPENGLPAISVRTPAVNLFLTGEDIRFHGLCGVPATSLECADAIVGSRKS